MSNVAVLYWSGTGNTEAMANAVAEGARHAGAKVDLFTCDAFSADEVANFDAFALGCPAMGDEVLEEAEFQPLFDAIKGDLKSKKVALFGSYGWGGGAWMESWKADCEAAGIALATDPVIAENDPDDEAKDACRALGAALA